ncbi:unnamed protein product [Phytophthora fragariaefolia]|uniref:Unnamed protein product n=1 Tax=Phytophthora fragariaefolia TaxID=1490495 RepID=A0A9W6Y4Z8_9STRA|nr:unnamed protein product [Phytophthora fragariaefolia]
MDGGFRLDGPSVQDRTDFMSLERAETRARSPTSHKIGDASDSEISETPGHNRNSRVGVLAASTASPSTSRSTEAAPPVAPVAPAPHVKLEGSGTASVSSTTAPSLPSISRSSATHDLTFADLERVLELRDNRLEFAQAERDVKLDKLVSYAVVKPFPEPSHELFRRHQGSSSIDELIAALEKEIVGGPHPAVVAGEQQADAFAARARADLLVHELREAMKRVSKLEESEETASALVRPVKEQVLNWRTGTFRCKSSTSRRIWSVIHGVHSSRRHHPRQGADHCINDH